MKDEQRKRRWVVTAATAAAAIGLAVGAYYWASESEAGVDIQTVSVTRGSIVDSVGASGTLEAVSTVLVGTQVTGRILELNADFNSIVRKGQVLARIDPSLYEAQVQQAQANLASAQANLERQRVALEDTRTQLQRARNLASRNLLAQVDLDAAEVSERAAAAQVKSAEAQIVQARASLSQAELNLAKTVILSPIDGIVISRDVDEGQTVSASTQAPTLFQLAADLDRMRVNASVDESDIGRLRPGQAATFQVDAFPERDFLGTVTQVRLQPRVDQNVVTYAVLVDVSNPDLMLRPGMTANVTIEVARRDNVLRVANAALRFRPQEETFALLGQEPESGRMVERAGTDSRTGRSIVPAVYEGATAGPAPVVARNGDGSGGVPLATTVDRLFDPFEPAETAGRIWVIRENRLVALPVRLGLGDGVVTELQGDGVEEGMEIVTVVREADTGQTASSGASNPFLLQGSRPPGR